MITFLRRSRYKELVKAEKELESTKQNIIKLKSQLSALQVGKETAIQLAQSLRVSRDNLAKRLEKLRHEKDKSDKYARHLEAELEKVKHNRL